MSDRPCDHLPAFMIEKDQKTGSLAFRAECILCGMHGRACASMDEAEQDWDLLTAGEPRRGCCAIIWLPVIAIAAALIWRAMV